MRKKKNYFHNYFGRLAKRSWLIGFFLVPEIFHNLVFWICDINGKHECITGINSIYSYIFIFVAIFIYANYKIYKEDQQTTEELAKENERLNATIPELDINFLNKKKHLTFQPVYFLEKKKEEKVYILDAPELPIDKPAETSAIIPEESKTVGESVKGLTFDPRVPDLTSLTQTVNSVAESMNNSFLKLAKSIQVPAFNYNFETMTPLLEENKYKREMKKWKKDNQSYVPVEIIMDAFKGKVPGKNIDVYLKFPIGLIPTSSTLKVSENPSPLANPLFFDRSSAKIDWISVDENVVTLHLHSLKHGHSYTFEPFYIHLEKQVQQTFTVKYNITADNLPIHLTGHLNFEMEPIFKNDSEEESETESDIS